jgi:uncharacterized small protein (DUF1192 family)
LVLENATSQLCSQVQHMLEVDALTNEKDSRIQLLEEEIERLKRENSQWMQQCAGLELQVAALLAKAQEPAP